MSNLITINYDNDRQTVGGRMLHEFLEVGTEYAKWITRMCEYGFVENVDFAVIVKNDENPQGGRPSTDHQLTIEMAKEICMLQRTEKGKQARQYFIELEKKWNSPEAVMARALKMADTKLLEYKSTVVQLETKVKELTPAAEFGKTVGSSSGGILIRDFVKLLTNDGIKIGQDQFFSWLHANGYIYRTSGYKPQWVAKRQYVDQGLFKMREIPISTRENGDQIKFTIRVTGKGQRYFYEKLKPAV